jgi:glycosyltransferase involved in cell wall biosynthesis
MEDQLSDYTGKNPIIDVIIPALNEENAIGLVVDAIPTPYIRNIIVVDNGSVDNTIDVAKNSGAVVLREPEKGYGAACLKGMDFIEMSKPIPDIVVFMDGDFSDHADEIKLLVDPIISGKNDFVVGSRILGNREQGSVTPQQIAGNKIASLLLKFLYDIHCTDLGPFRAIRYSSLMALKMEDRNFGWTVEMQLKAAKNNLNVSETPVSYRRRIGYSKVSGTLKGSIMAAYKIIITIFKYA